MRKVGAILPRPFLLPAGTRAKLPALRDRINLPILLKGRTLPYRQLKGVAAVRPLAIFALSRLLTRGTISKPRDIHDGTGRRRFA